jgi:hypothetical protein
LELSNQSLPTFYPGINHPFSHAIYTWCVAPSVREYCIQSGTKPACITCQAIEALVSAFWFFQRALRKLFLDFQDLCRIHD